MDKMGKLSEERISLDLNLRTKLLFGHFLVDRNFGRLNESSLVRYNPSTCKKTAFDQVAKLLIYM
jgi:hypothetical protein